MPVHQLMSRCAVKVCMLLLSTLMPAHTHTNTLQVVHFLIPVLCYNCVCVHALLMIENRCSLSIVGSLMLHYLDMKRHNVIATNFCIVSAQNHAGLAEDWMLLSKALSSTLYSQVTCLLSFWHYTVMYSSNTNIAPCKLCIQVMQTSASNANISK